MWLPLHEAYPPDSHTEERLVALREVQFTGMAPEGRNHNTVQVQFEA